MVRPQPIFDIFLTFFIFLFVFKKNLKAQA